MLIQVLKATHLFTETMKKNRPLKVSHHENNSLLNHDSLSKIVKDQIREITMVNESKITRKNKDIVNEFCEKMFKLGYDK